MTATSHRKRPERIPLRVVKGGFAPADNFAAGRLRSRNYNIGDLVFAEIKKPRSPGFHFFAHALGTLVSENLDDFEGMDAHAVLKRLQIESGTACDEVAYRVPGYGMVIQRIPRSLSFESMDEGQFREVMRNLSRWIAKEYWPSCTPEEIEDMAQCMVGES